jgi:hypothetical protein
LLLARKRPESLWQLAPKNLIGGRDDRPNPNAGAMTAQVDLEETARSPRSALQLHLSSEWLGYAASLMLLAVYSSTLLPGLHHFGDTTKAQFLAYFGGMTHPTGYPLYIGMTWPLSQVPLGSLALRINFFSAVCGALASLSVYGIGRTLATRSGIAAGAAAVFGLSRTMWDQSVIAEVYSLNAALVGAGLFFLIRWISTAKRRNFLIACAIYSLSFGNHLTVVTLLPAFVVAVALGPWRQLLRFRIIALVVFSMVLGAAQYSYLFFASASESIYVEYNVTNWDEFANFVSGDHYRGNMLAFSVDELVTKRLPMLVARLASDMGPVCLLGAMGVGALMNSSRNRLLAVLLTAFFGEAAWFLSYSIPDIEVYSISVALFVAVFIGAAFELVAKSVLGTRLSGTLLAVAVLGLLALNAPDHRKSIKFEKRLGEQIRAADEDAVLVGLVDYSYRMGWVYRLYVDGLARERGLHMAHASPEGVEQYLNGDAPLRDYHTRESIPYGKTLLLAPRALRQQSWGIRLKTTRKVGSLRALELSERK